MLYVKRMGFTHVEFLPVAEHAFYPSWGYQVTGFYAPTSRYGTPEDFQFLVNALHEAGIGVIVDWVPAHFPRDDWALAKFDGTALYEHEDPRKGAHQDWGTLIFNFGRNEVNNFLVANALFWLDRFHIDGLRVDAVASMLYLDYSRKEGEWIPNQYGGRENLEAIEFLRKFNYIAHTEFPGIVTIAEESTAWPQVTRPPYLGGLGFSFKWNMGWMHDTLDYFKRDPVHRKFHQNDLTFATLYHHSENFILPLSHDEVVHGKASLIGRMPGDDWQKFANLRALLAYQWLFPGKKLLFMGDEIGQRAEWNENGQLDWWLLDAGPFHRGLQRFVEDLNKLYIATPALWQGDYDHGGFYWIDCADRENSVLSFVRQTADGTNPLAVILNLTPVPREKYRVGLPRAGPWREVLNSDAGDLCRRQPGKSGRRHRRKCSLPQPAAFRRILSAAHERHRVPAGIVTSWERRRPAAVADDSFQDVSIGVNICVYPCSSVVYSSAVKLISWNVNGLRAVLRKNFLDFLDAEKPDVLCLQETKCSPDDVEQLWPRHLHDLLEFRREKGLFRHRHFYPDPSAEGRTPYRPGRT